MEKLLKNDSYTQNINQNKKIYLSSLYNLEKSKKI